jgi:hypothetical protein
VLGYSTTKFHIGKGISLFPFQFALGSPLRHVRRHHPCLHHLGKGEGIGLPPPPRPSSSSMPSLSGLSGQDPSPDLEVDWHDSNITISLGSDRLCSFHCSGIRRDRARTPRIRTLAGPRNPRDRSKRRVGSVRGNWKGTTKRAVRANLLRQA